MECCRHVDLCAIRLAGGARYDLPHGGVTGGWNVVARI